MAGRIRVHFIRTWVDNWGNKYAKFLINDDDTNNTFDIEIRSGKHGREESISTAQRQAVQEFEDAQT